MVAACDVNTVSIKGNKANLIQGREVTTMMTMTTTTTTVMTTLWVKLVLSLAYQVQKRCYSLQILLQQCRESAEQ